MVDRTKALAEAAQALRDHAWRVEQDRLAQQREDARQAQIAAAQEALAALRTKQEAEGR